eukprot:gene9958-13391_t
MAKGIRSKSKRKNRSQLRSTLSVPIQRKRQEILALSLQKSINAKDGKSIKSLKSLFVKREGSEDTNIVNKSTNDNQSSDDEENEQDESNEEIQNEGNELRYFTSNKKTAADKKKELKLMAYKANKLRNASKKELVWFK